MENERPTEDDGSGPAQAGRSALASLVVNLAGSIAGVALTLWLAAAMNSWPIEKASGILYALIAPLLLVAPLWSIVGLIFAARILRGPSRSELHWPARVAFWVALSLALAALPGFVAALARVLQF